MSHRSSSSKSKLSRSKSSKSVASGSTSSKSTSSSRASTEKLGMGGNSSDWIQYQARLRKSRQTRKGTSIKNGIDDSCSRTSSKRSTLSKHSTSSGHPKSATLSKHSTSSKHSRRTTYSKHSTSSKLPSSSDELHGDNKGGTVRSEVVRGDKSSVRSTILKSDDCDEDEIGVLGDQNTEDMCNEEKMTSDDVTIDIDN
jgi:hypothetical protein